MKNLILSLLIIISFSVLGQTGGSILVISNVNSRLVVDGETVSDLTKSTPFKYEIESGEHYVQVFAENGAEQNEIITIVSGKQKVLKYEFNKDQKDDFKPMSIVVTNSSIRIPGLLSEEDFTFYYAFEKGDQVSINIDMTNAKGTNNISFFSYPNSNIKYSNSNFQDLSNVKIVIKERSIYGITLKSNHTFDREAKIKIERIPNSIESKDFNTEVILKEFYEVIPVAENQKFYINSTSNAAISGGKSRVAVPITLPENTVKWYYNFSASRDADQIESVSNSMNLLAELTNLIDATGTLSFGIESLSKPPGSDYCDIYLIDHDNYNLFLAKEPISHYPIGTRENFTSGVVELTCCFDKQYYLGISNTSGFHGINVLVNISAITLKHELVMVND